MNNIFSGLRVHATCRSDQSAENVGLKLATDMKNSSENSFGINSVGMYVFALCKMSYGHKLVYSYLRCKEFGVHDFD